jgi:hypothetical protein
MEISGIRIKRQGQDVDSWSGTIEIDSGRRYDGIHLRVSDGFQELVSLYLPYEAQDELTEFLNWLQPAQEETEQRSAAA